MTFWTSSVFTGLSRSSFVESHISSQAHALAEQFPELVSCRVAVESGGVGGVEHVRIGLVVPEAVVHVAAAAETDRSQESLRELVDRAFARARSALVGRRRTWRPRVVTHATSGRVGAASH